MNHFFTKIHRLLPHLTIILSLTFIVFTILDWYNPLMGFTTNPLSTKLLVLFCLASLLLALDSLLFFPRQKRRTPPNKRPYSS